MDLRVSEVKSSGAEERLVRAYEERERLELLVYEAVAVRAAVVRGIAMDLDTARGGGEGHAMEARRAELSGRPPCDPRKAEISATRAGTWTSPSRS